MFDAALGPSSQAAPGLSIFAETCGDALVLEHNGDVYSCDHFVTPEHLLGNILGIPLVDLVRRRASASPYRRARQPAALLPGVRGPLRLQRQVSQKPLHRHAGQSPRPQLSLRWLSQVLQPRQPLHAKDGRFLLEAWPPSGIMRNCHRPVRGSISTGSVPRRMSITRSPRDSTKRR